MDCILIELYGHGLASGLEEIASVLIGPEKVVNDFLDFCEILYITKDCPTNQDD